MGVPARVNRVAVPVAGLLLLACFAGLAVVRDLRANVVPFVLLYGAAYLVFGAVVWWATRAHESRFALPAIIVFAVLFRVTMLFTTPPTLSDDVYRYIWDGRLMNAGVNPYSYIVESPELDWLMVANHTGLAHEGVYLDEASTADTIDLLLLDEWSTDDDTAVEWVDLHILEIYGLEPTYAQIRDEWIAHLNNDIWCSTLRARELMDQGIVPPETGSAALNPEGVWSIDAQLQTELFGLIAPGLPAEASRRAVYFARVTNSGLAVDASAFYATMYALAFFQPDVHTLIAEAQGRVPSDSEIAQIVDQVVSWHARYPGDWRETRRRVRDVYDIDPS